MGKRKYKIYIDEFTLEAVRLLEVSGRPAAEHARPGSPALPNNPLRPSMVPGQADEVRRDGECFNRRGGSTSGYGW